MSDLDKSSVGTPTMFDAYGEYAKRLKDPLMLSGRNRFQAQEVAAAADDVLRKLVPRSGERLLEIGCNIGLILSRLAPHFESCVGQDHADLLAVYRDSGVPKNVELFPGYWPQAQPDGQFDCIVAYSVFQLMPDAEGARRFVNAAREKLRPGGRLLIGDVSNIDSRRRFLHSVEGAEVARRYDATRSQDRAIDKAGEYVARDEIHSRFSMPDEYIDDGFLVGLLVDARAHGFEAYILPQPSGLPFSSSREDFLVVRRR